MTQDMTGALGVGNPLGTEVGTVTVFQQTAPQGIGATLVGGHIDRTPLLHLKVGTHTQLVMMAVGQTETIGGGQRQTVVHHIRGGIVLTRRGVDTDDTTGGIGLETVTGTIGSSQRQQITFAKLLLVLHTEVELVVPDGCGILFHQVFRRADAGDSGKRAVELAPEIGGIETDRQGLEDAETGTQEQLMHAAVALVGAGLYGLRPGDGRCGAILITDIRIRQDTERHA